MFSNDDRNFPTLKPEDLDAFDGLNVQSNSGDTTVGTHFFWLTILGSAIRNQWTLFVHAFQFLEHDQHLMPDDAATDDDWNALDAARSTVLDYFGNFGSNYGHIECTESEVHWLLALCNGDKKWSALSID